MLDREKIREYHRKRMRVDRERRDRERIMIAIFALCVLAAFVAAIFKAYL